MSALNLIMQPTAAHLICDAATYAPDGKIISLMGKIVTVPGHRLAIAGRGRIAPQYYGQAIAMAEAYGQLNHHMDVLDAMVPMVRALVDANDEAFPDDVGVRNQVQLSAIWWDDVNDRPMASTVGSGHLSLLPGMDPFTRYSGGIGWLNPAFHGREAFEDRWNELDPVTDGAAILQAQRTRPDGWNLGGEPFVSVGGWGEAATVTRDGVDLREICRWPEDRPGQKIAA